MKKISIFDAVPGMILAKPVTVLDKTGVELMQSGFVLQKSHIKKLSHWGIESIHIESFDDIYESANVFPESIRMLANQTYEDAIDSLSRMSKALVVKGDVDLREMSRNVTNVLDVISLEPGLLALLSMVKESEEYVYKHCVDVCVTSLVIARYMKCSEEDLHILGTACLLHDIGLIRFNGNSWDKCLITRDPEDLAMHPVYSRDIASSVRGIDQRTLKVIEQHHEMSDGGGYPSGTGADGMDPLSSILAICEAYCTLVSPHDYESSIAPSEAITIIIDPSKNRFTPAILRAFISNMSLYPSGTFVEMNNRVRAVVLSSNIDKPLRPNILALFDEHNRPVKPFAVDLSSPKYRDWYIDNVVPGNNFSDALTKLIKV